MTRPGTPSSLPEELVRRLVVVVAEALPRIGRLPVGLRRVAEFAPQRRARLGSAAIEAALEDDEFRRAAAVQVVQTHPDWEQEPASLSPVDRAAAAWLLRPEGWEEEIADFLDARETSDEAAAGREVDQLRDRIAHLEDAARRTKEEHRATVEGLRAENRLIRQRLGEARAQARAAEQRVESGKQTEGESLVQLRAELAALDKELRQARAQQASAATATSAERRAVKAMRTEESVRARVLLETLLEAATGLQRELALPPVTGRPADRVDERHAVPLAEALPTGAGGVPESQVLAHVLAMPRARLLIDGYNVSKSAWPSSTLEAQRIRLLGLLAPVVAQSGVETTVVFDAHTAPHRPVVNAPRGIKVAFSPQGVLADDVLVEYMEAEPEGRVVVLVTSDQELGERARRLGARVVRAATLIDLLAR